MPATFPPYHLSLVVEDVAAATSELSGMFGLEWAKPQHGGQFTYSLQGPPYLELLQRRDGTYFDTAGLHHIGVWVDDVNAEAARLESAGCIPDRVERDEAGNIKPGCFFLTPSGLRVELVQIGTSGPRLVRMLSGGDYA